MVQQLSVNLTIPIPQDSVLIGKVELEELRKLELSGVYWNMKESEHRTGKKHEWLKENILFRQQFRKGMAALFFIQKGKVRLGLFKHQRCRLSSIKTSIEFLGNRYKEKIIQ